MNDYIITLDVDWASDYVIDYVADKLVRSKVRATWFITHDSPSIRSLFRYDDLFEIGLHPNFMDGSTQGDSPARVMEHLKNIYPLAESVRTHGLFQSSPLLKQLVDEFGVKYDSSLFLPYTKNIEPHGMYYRGSGELIRLPYFWSDYTEANHPSRDFSFANPKYHMEGMKVFNFHPVHVALNTEDVRRYDELRASVRISACKKADIDRFRNRSAKGAENVFDALLDKLKDGILNSKTIAGTANEWKKQRMA
ncbi:MAG: hypothetical protein AB1458_13920 [Bacteroidota bacterium]